MSSSPHKTHCKRSVDELLLSTRDDSTVHEIESENNNHKKIFKTFKSEAAGVSNEHVILKECSSHMLHSSEGGKKTKKKKCYEYGNYDRYYGYRKPTKNGDKRLSLMKSEHFENKDVLDIGCNNGFITLAIVQKFDPASIVGLDIDGDLISIARKKRVNFKREHSSSTKIHFEQVHES